ncbi:Nudix hydrolase 11 [Psilocybe cubensis]|uniref:Nudix hydrolase domain-containing protein n=2 Tax=Psilocybe cubensis TaxID=181762 RepID=A0A8H8CM71_PSICU|nr:Nudix hydrolase 11 [Psilocybe cubensis]KAH9481727.1 Nudix hydrolase 11 [Psilocybe cubensis]
MTSCIPKDALKSLSEQSAAAINNLVSYFSTLEQPDLSGHQLKKIAAVLALLYEEDGKLRVLLTTRSRQLRTHAGQTALPGGKWDPTDASLAETAYREANEEVGLPINSPCIHTLGLLSPFISLHKILVTPVVAFLSDNRLLSTLRAAEAEVSQIFSHQLEAILDPSLAKHGPLVPIGSEDWPYETEVYNTSDSVVPMLDNTVYRMHRFRTSASPIKGLTSDILIKIAEVAFARPTKYGRYAPSQLKNIVDIVKAVEKHDTVMTIQ